MSHPRPLGSRRPAPASGVPRRSFSARPAFAGASLVLALALTGSLGSLSVAGAASAAGQNGTDGRANRVVDTHQVTLITGEKVLLTEHADGLQTASVAPDGTRDTQESYTTLRAGDDLYLIPDSAQPYLAQDSLDLELFNISQLVDDGYDDQGRATIPLIVTYSENVARALDRPAPQGSVKARKLPSVDAVALRESKDKASTFWEALDDDRAKAPQPRLAGGIEKIWLDRPMHASLDQSVKQIGAPTAWAAGFDGAGVKVAVLDSGVDPTHPDLTGVVKESRNFTTDADAVDHHGHGTHVASTIAGSGAASGGKYKGVAPKTDLYIGKVLDGTGSGSESSVIAGMEWAANTVDADVINMSLGSSSPSDGTDPISQAVNRLTESSGALFVIAAGNSGPGKSTVGSPGAADAALTVGNVTKQEALAPTSSRGPRLNDFAVKPEITGPGTAIVAARAAGTTMGSPVDATYTSASGTSMASPHVAGAAALLAQKHPEWTPDRLKQVLVGTAKSGTFTAYQQGGGRVDVPKALDATVYADPAVVSLGRHERDGQPITRPLEYVNPTDAEVTVALNMVAFGESAPPEGMFTLGATNLTVPAHGRGSVDFTYDPRLGTIGDYTAIITATSSDGTAFHTTVGATKDIPMVDVTLTGIDRHGKLGPTEWVAFDLDNRKLRQFFSSTTPTTVQLPLGRYSVMAYIRTTDPASGVLTDFTLGGNPELVLEGPKSVTVDARDAKKVQISTPEESVVTISKLGYRQQIPGLGGLDALKTLGSNLDGVYVVPTEPTSVSDFEFDYQERSSSPTIKAAYADGTGAIPLRPVTYALSLYGNKTLQAVNAGLARPAELEGRDLSGKLAVITRDPSVRTMDQLAAIATTGAEAAVLVNDRPGPFSTIVPRVLRTKIPAWSLTQDAGQQLLARIHHGRTNVSLRGIGKDPQVYNVALMVPDTIPADPTDAVTSANSATTHADYRGPAGTYIGDSNAAVRPGEASLFNLIDYFDAPSSRTEWYSTGNKWPTSDQMRWWHTVHADDADISRQIMGAITGYAPGSTRDETWLGAAITAGGPQGGGAVRDGDALIFGLPEWVDSGGHYGWSGNTTDHATARLFREGELVREIPCPACRNVIAVGADNATYRLTLETQRPDWMPLSTRTSTEWTFQSARPTADSEQLAMLWPRYELELDDQNRMSARGTRTFDLSILTASGEVSSLEELKVWASGDDGGTWSSAETKRKSDGSYTVTVPAVGSGYVSLRVSARDGHGSAVTQTLIRAYEVH
ncbi:S8 family serine peptidase [Micromonospora sp. NPDC002717]|uniref:S8 family serine peptidase n=1 Tax=Micromonospora sp. NPDC002717 TaxID=3154424 RepID=UPI003316ECE0